MNSRRLAICAVTCAFVFSGCATESLVLDWDGKVRETNLGGAPTRDVERTDGELLVALHVFDEGSPFIIDDESGVSLVFEIDPELSEGEHTVALEVAYPSEYTVLYGYDDETAPTVTALADHDAGIARVYPAMFCQLLESEPRDLTLTGTLTVERLDGSMQVGVALDLSGEWPCAGDGVGTIHASFALTEDEVAGAAD